MSDERYPREGDGWTPAVLAELREADQQRRAALVAAALVGLGAAMVHWLGLFVAGALVGLVSESLSRAVAAGLAMGALVLLVHVGASPVMGPGEFVGLAPASYVTIAAGLVAPLWGSLVRGVV
jgi:hypothetical protein